MQYHLFPTEQFSFFSLASGSNGNCYYLGNSRYGLLIDAGIGVRTIKKRLKEHNIDIASIRAVLVTHDHWDHIKSIGNLGERLFIPVYATHKVHRGIEHCHLVREKLNGSRRYIEKEKPFRIEDFSITAFDVPHDSSDNAGYYFEFGNHSLTLATDVGAITEDVARYVRKAQHLVIEANYDEEMLRNGSYPAHLKARITNGTGHLSNRQTAEFLADNCGAHLKNIWLCHLSGDNNCPELAYETVAKTLEARGIILGGQLSLNVFRRNTLSEIFNF